MKYHTLFLLLLLLTSATEAQKYISFYNKGNYEKALVHAEKAIDESSKNFDAYLYKSLCYMHLATGEDTKEEYPFGIESSLTTLRFLYNKDKSKTYFPAHAAEVDSIISAASAHAFNLYEAGKLSRVEKMIGKLLELSPRPEHYYLYGKYLQDMEMEHEAIEAFNTAAAKIYLDYKKGIIPEPYLSETFIALANSIAADYDFGSASVIYCRALDIFRSEEVEDECLRFLSYAESTLRNYSDPVLFESFFHYSDSMITFMIDPSPVYELQWSAVQKYYDGLITEKSYNSAGALMLERACGSNAAMEFILNRIYDQTKVLYAIEQKKISDARDELLICIQLLDCNGTAAENEKLMAAKIDSLIIAGAYSSATRLMYNFKLIAINKSLPVQLENNLYNYIKSLHDSSMASVDLYEIFQYFPDNKNLKALQKNSSLALIDKYIREQKFTLAGDMIHKQIALYPKDASLHSLFRMWVIEDFQANYEGSDIDHDQLGWTGNYDECEPGKISEEANKKFLQRLNYVRRLAGLPDQSVLREEWNQYCMAAALMMGANGQLSHHPPKDWSCFTDEGYKGASNSNLSLGARDVDALIGQLDDYGIPSCGHRRWILNPYRKVFGHGSTTGTMVLWALGGKDANYPSEVTEKFESQFVAWPPAGYVPTPLFSSYWSIARENCDFEKATVEVTAGGNKIECEVLEQEFGYGQNTLVFEVPGLSMFNQKDLTYTVTLKNVRVYDGYDSEGLVNERFIDYSYTVTFIPVYVY